MLLKFQKKNNINIVLFALIKSHSNEVLVLSNRKISERMDFLLETRKFNFFFAVEKFFLNLINQIEFSYED